MKLWHEALIPYLPKRYLLGAHRECCALRKGNWNTPDPVVGYVFDHPREWLFCYHLKVMREMMFRKYKVDLQWFDIGYRGKDLPKIVYDETNAPNLTELNQKLSGTVYPEQDIFYLDDCLEILERKGYNLWHIFDHKEEN
jgi:uncharacterized protein (TIGR02328 family)